MDANAQYLKIQELKSYLIIFIIGIVNSCSHSFSLSFPNSNWCKDICASFKELTNLKKANHYTSKQKRKPSQKIAFTQQLERQDMSELNLYL